MRKNILKLSAIGLISIALYACKKNKEETIVSNNGLSPSMTVQLDYTSVGILHNKAMDDCYESLLKLESLENKSTEYLYSFAKDDIAKGLEENLNYRMSFSDIYNSLNRNNIKEEFTFDNTNSDLVIVNEAQKELRSFVDMNPELYISKVDEILANYLAQLDNEESKLALNIIGEVAKKSNLYWTNNEEKWSKLLNTEYVPGALPPGYKGRVVDADINGAWQGALTGLIGGPVGSVLGGLLSSAVSSSWQGIVEYRRRSTGGAGGTW